MNDEKERENIIPAKINIETFKLIYEKNIARSPDIRTLKIVLTVNGVDENAEKNRVTITCDDPKIVWEMLE
jgi:hypothetical protein